MDEAILKSILQEVKIIKKLLAHNLLTDDAQVKQIAKLDSIGFRPTEIADILATSSNSVNVALNRIRKSRRKESKKKEAL